MLFQFHVVLGWYSELSTYQPDIYLMKTYIQEKTVPCDGLHPLISHP